MKVRNKNGDVLAQTQDESEVPLAYDPAYAEGDVLCVESSEAERLVILQLDDRPPHLCIYLRKPTVTLAEYKYD